MSNLTTTSGDSAIMEAVVAGGDLARLTPAQRTQWYVMRCEAAGLDPRTQPFQYITLQGKLTLYATKTATEQLCQSRNISTQILSRERSDGLCIVTCRATSAEGRYTESIGAVNVESLKGDALANALMKAETKAKRRAVLALCGLGMLDETEAETIPGAQIITAPVVGDHHQGSPLPTSGITTETTLDAKRVKFLVGSRWLELAEALPPYYRDAAGNLDSWHIRGTLAKLGIATVGPDNDQDAFNALVDYAKQNADAEAA